MSLQVLMFKYIDFFVSYIERKYNIEGITVILEFYFELVLNNKHILRVEYNFDTYS